jgi:citrate lyase subunit beta/citryl-CoA lyase
MFRSLLYVPASSERFIAKAHERDADAIILDLEDSVAPGEKAGARATLATSVAAVARNGAKVFVRINSEPDRRLVDAEAACRAGAFGLFVTKTREPQDVVRLGQYLDEVERRTGRARTLFIPMIEEPGPVFDARAIAKADARVFGLMVGGEDSATAMGGEPTPELLRLPKLLVHMAAKAAGVYSFGLLRTVADYNDSAGIEASAHEARSFGFDGATCVHPSVVPILNRVFSPSAAEIERARRMIAAYDASLAAGLGACVFEGKMIDVPVVARARALLAKQDSRAQP